MKVPVPFRPAALALAALLFAGAAIAQQTHEVHMYISEVEGRPVPEFYFEPTGLYVQPGDTLRFIADTPHHTVTAMHERHGFPTRVPEGVGPFSSPVVPIGDTWEYTFEEPGVYDLVCMPHFAFAMAMRVVVGEASGPGAEPAAEEQFGPEGMPVAVLLNAPALTPDAIVDGGAVAWADVEDEHKTLPPFLQMPPEGEAMLQHH